MLRNDKIYFNKWKRSHDCSIGKETVGFASSRSMMEEAQMSDPGLGNEQSAPDNAPHMKASPEYDKHSPESPPDKPYWSHLLTELEQVDGLILPIKASQRIKYTCIAVSERYITLGASTGAVYVFLRTTCKYALMLPGDREGSVINAAFGPDDNFLAYATSTGAFVAVELNILTDKSSSKPNRLRVTNDHKGALITSLCWAQDGKRVFIGDDKGKVTAANIVPFKARDLLTVPSEVIMKLPSPVVQVDCHQDRVLVATLQRTYIGNTSKHHFKQVGKKPRDGRYGACFYPTPGVRQGALVYCARPGSRLWEADRDGEVLNTHQFKQLLGVPPANVLRVCDPSSYGIDSRDHTTPQSLAFDHLHVIRERFLLAVCDKGLYVLDPAEVKVIVWTKHVGDFLQIKTLGSELYILLKDNSVRHLTFISTPRLIAKLHDLRLWRLCALVAVTNGGVLLKPPSWQHVTVAMVTELVKQVESDDGEFRKELRMLLRDMRAEYDKRNVNDPGLTSGQEFTPLKSGIYRMVSRTISTGSDDGAAGTSCLKQRLDTSAKSDEERISQDSVSISSEELSSDVALVSAAAGAIVETPVGSHGVETVDGRLHIQETGKATVEAGGERDPVLPSDSDSGCDVRFAEVLPAGQSPVIGGRRLRGEITPTLEADSEILKAGIESETNNAKNDVNHVTHAKAGASFAKSTTDLTGGKIHDLSEELIEQVTVSQGADTNKISRCQGDSAVDEAAALVKDANVNNDGIGGHVALLSKVTSHEDKSCVTSRFTSQEAVAVGGCMTSHDVSQSGASVTSQDVSQSGAPVTSQTVSQSGAYVTSQDVSQSGAFARETLLTMKDKVASSAKSFVLTLREQGERLSSRESAVDVSECVTTCGGVAETDSRRGPDTVSLDIPPGADPGSGQEGDSKVDMPLWASDLAAVTFRTREAVGEPRVLYNPESCRRLLRQWLQEVQSTYSLRGAEGLSIQNGEQTTCANCDDVISDEVDSYVQTEVEDNDVRFSYKKGKLRSHVGVTSEITSPTENAVKGDDRTSAKGQRTPTDCERIFSTSDKISQDVRCTCGKKTALGDIPRSLRDAVSELMTLCVEFGVHREMSETSRGQPSLASLEPRDRHRDVTSDLAAFFGTYHHDMKPERVLAALLVTQPCDLRYRLWTAYVDAVAECEDETYLTNVRSIDDYLEPCECHKVLVRSRSLFKRRPRELLEYHVSDMSNLSPVHVLYICRHGNTVDADLVEFALLRLKAKNHVPRLAVLGELCADGEVYRSLLEAFLRQGPDVAQVTCQCGAPRPGAHKLPWRHKAILQDLVTLGLADSSSQLLTPRDLEDLLHTYGYWMGYLRVLAFLRQRRELETAGDMAGENVKQIDIPVDRCDVSFVEKIAETVMQLGDSYLLKPNCSWGFRPQTLDEWKMLLALKSRQTTSVGQNEGKPDITPDDVITECRCLSCASLLTPSVNVENGMTKIDTQPVEVAPRLGDEAVVDITNVLSEDIVIQSDTDVICGDHKPRSSNTVTDPCLESKECDKIDSSANQSYDKSDPVVESASEPDVPLGVDPASNVEESIASKASINYDEQRLDTSGSVTPLQSALNPQGNPTKATSLSHDVISWEDLANLLVLNLGSEQALQVLMHDVNLPQGALSLEFFQRCIIAKSIEKRQSLVLHNLLESVDTYLWSRRPKALPSKIRDALVTAADETTNAPVSQVSWLSRDEDLAGSPPRLKKTNVHWGAAVDLRGSCLSCGVNLLCDVMDADVAVVVFRCGHVFHKSCCHDVAECHVCLSRQLSDSSSDVIMTR